MADEDNNIKYLFEKLLATLEKQNTSNERMIVTLTELKDMTVSGFEKVESAIKAGNGHREKNMWRVIMVLVAALLIALGVDVTKIGLF